MVKIYEIENLDEVAKHYPHWNPIGGYYLQFDKKNCSAYVINSQSCGFSHSRIIKTDQSKRASFDLALARLANELTNGKESIGLHVLPATNQFLRGGNVEHLFSRTQTNKELEEVMKNMMVSELSLSGTFYEDYYVELYDKNEIKFMEISRTSAKKDSFDFHKVINIKNGLFGPDEWLAAPIIDAPNDYSLVYVQWPGKIPNLIEMYNYDKAPRKKTARPLKDFVQLKYLEERN